MHEKFLTVTIMMDNIKDRNIDYKIRINDNNTISNSFTEHKKNE